MQIVQTVWGNRGKMLSFLKVLKIFDESLARNVIGKTLETLKTLKIKS